MFETNQLEDNYQGSKTFYDHQNSTSKALSLNFLVAGPWGFLAWVGHQPTTPTNTASLASVGDLMKYLKGALSVGEDALELSFSQVTIMFHTISCQIPPSYPPGWRKISSNSLLMTSFQPAMGLGQMDSEAWQAVHVKLFLSSTLSLVIISGTGWVCHPSGDPQRNTNAYFLDSWKIGTQLHRLLAINLTIPSYNAPIKGELLKFTI